MSKLSAEIIHENGTSTVLHTERTGGTNPITEEIGMHYDEYKYDILGGGLLVKVEADMAYNYVGDTLKITMRS